MIRRFSLLVGVFALGSIIVLIRDFGAFPLLLWILGGTAILAIVDKNWRGAPSYRAYLNQLIEGDRLRSAFFPGPLYALVNAMIWPAAIPLYWVSDRIYNDFWSDHGHEWPPS